MTKYRSDSTANSAVAEREYGQTEDLFKTISLYSPVGTYIVVDGKFVFVNPRFAADTGYTQDEFQEIGAVQLIHPDDREMVRQYAIEMLKKQRFAPYEYRALNKYGETRWMVESVSSVRYMGKRATLGTVVDVTASKLAEEQAQLMALFAELNPAPVLRFDQDGNILMANKAAQDLLSSGPLAGRPLSDIMPGVKDIDPFDCIRSGTILSYDAKINGNWLHFIFQGIPDKGIGQVYGSDITELKQAEKAIEEKARELEEVNIRLQEMDRLKSVFLASMSHELRTPLNSIIGFTSLMMGGMVGELNQEQVEQLGFVKQAAEHLLSLINDVLDISKVESGKIELATEEFRLDEVVQEVLQTLSPIAGAKGLELSGDTPEGILIMSDRRRVKQILMNLANNAVKFTDQGSVKVITEKAGRKSIIMHVTDTGVGIREGDLARLFMPFQQVDMDLTKKSEGTGLGLHHSRILANILGGDISVESEYGRGSVFSFSLPVRRRSGDEKSTAG
jgi:PAS domain S-box-containing protein